MGLRNDAWNSFVAVEGLCKTKMLRVCPRLIGLVELLPETKEGEVTRLQPLLCDGDLGIRFHWKSRVRSCCLGV